MFWRTELRRIRRSWSVAFEGDGSMLRGLRNVLTCAVVGCCLITPLVARAENWPQWRGAHHDGISHEKNITSEWDIKGKNVRWKVEMPGPGGASPIVWDNQVFVTSAADADLVLMSLDKEGHQLWKKKIGTGNKVARSDEGNFASPSPSTDGQHVWAFVGSGDLVCYDFAGNEKWHINLQDRYGKFNIQFGMSSTPILDSGRLYLQLIHGEGNPKTREAVVVALDAATGKEIWKQDRPSEASDENEHSYASPTFYDDGKLKCLITHGADYVIAHSLDDGHELWRSGGINPPEKYNRFLRLVASPAIGPGIVVVPSAKNGPVLAIDPYATGDVTNSKTARLWTRAENTPDVSSPLIVDGIVYLCRESGIMLTLDAKTGQQIYMERIHNHRHRASPVYADGKIYCTARDGVVTVLKAGRQFELLNEIKMDEDISASPAVSNGRIYIRSFQNLWCIGSTQVAEK